MSNSKRNRRKNKFASDIVESNPNPFQREFERLANINVGFEQYAEGAGSNADSSGSGLVVDYEDNMEVGLNCQVSPNNNSVVADSQPGESSGWISQCDINSQQPLAWRTTPLVVIIWI